MIKTTRIEGYVYFLGFIGAIILGNWLLGNWGTVRFSPHDPWMVPVLPAWIMPGGETLYAPSGVIAVGLSFTLRDLVQRRLGWRFAFVAIVAGAGVSMFIDPRLALASGVTFLVAETLDLMVYTPLQKNHLILAVIGSNAVGIIADSIIFLSLAFGSLAFLNGQIVGKAWMTFAALPVIILLREVDRRRGVVAYDEGEDEHEEIVAEMAV